MKAKELFNNDLNKDGHEIYGTVKDANLGAIQSSVDNLKNLIVTDKGYAIDVDNATDLDELKNACRDLIKAVDGKFVSRYVLSK